jgi:hypothetical protein
MSCFISDGYTLDCRNASIGGIKELWILGDSGHTISGYTTSGTDEITSFSGAGTWYNFELVKQSSSFTEEVQVNDVAQSVTFAPSIVVSLPKLDQSLRNLFFDLVKQNELQVIVKDNNERYWMVGLANGLLVSSGSMATGQAYNDLNGITLTMTGGEPEASREIDVTTTLAAVASGFTVQS